MATSLTLALGAFALCLVLCFLSAVFPFVNAEIVLLSLVAATHGWAGVLALVIAATVGQMGGKSVMYWLGRGAAAVPSERHRKTLERWRQRFERAPRAIVLFVMLSAFTGIPPFYVVSVLSGAFRTNFAAFVAAGAAGRFLRFALIATVPGAIAHLTHG